MQKLRRAEARRGLADAVLVEEVLDHAEAAALTAEDRRARHAHVGQADVGVVGRHVERPQELDHLEPGRVGRHEERRDPVTVAGRPARAGEDQVVLRLVDPGVPRLLAVDDPVVAVADGGGLHVRGVGAVLGLGDPEGEAAAALGEVVDPLGLLLVGAVLQHQQQPDVVADDGVLVLQVVVQAEALGGEVLADHGHAEVGPVLAAVLLRERVAVVAGGVGPPAGLAEQRLPLLVGQPAAVPVGAGVLPAVVEEADVVVLLLERLDLAFDELVELGEVGDEVGWQVEVHVSQLGSRGERRPTSGRTSARRR